MKFSTLALVAMALVGVLTLGSCKKDDDAAPSSKGTTTLDGASYTINASTSFSDDDDDGLAYQLIASGANTTQSVGIYLVIDKKPKTTGVVTLGAVNYVYATTFSTANPTVATTRYYRKDGDAYNVTVSGGKLTISMTNLTETDLAGASVAGGKPLTATFSE